KSGFESRYRYQFRHDHASIARKRVAFLEILRMSTSAVSPRNPAIPLTKNDHLLRWVEKMAELTRPAKIHWVDGSKEEYDQLCAEMVAGGTFVKLNEKLWPGCYYARSDSSDVARDHFGAK